MNWKLYLKIGITLVMLGVIYTSVDLKGFGDVLLGLPAWSSLLVICGYIVGQVVSTFKWRILAVAGGIAVSVKEALRAYFIGMFVNCFGLGMVGGDVVRGLLVSGEEHSRTLGVTSVVADRVHGLAVLAGLGALSAFFFQPEFLDARLVILLTCIGVGVVSGWVLGPTLAKRFLSEDSRIGRKLIQLSGMLSRDRGTLVSVTLLSILFHLLQIVLHWIIIFSMGVEIPFSYLLTTVPFINILSSLPISWNGVGVREAGYIFFFTSQYPFLSQEQAIAMGVLWLLGVTAASALGGIVAFLSKDFSLRSVGRSTGIPAAS